jgi:hypothetical protein
MNLYPAGALWFIERFVPTLTAQNFAKRVNNLEAMTDDAAQKMRLRRDKHARWDFTFVPLKSQILVIPNSPESEWSRGVIWFDSDNVLMFSTLGADGQEIALPPIPQSEE